LLLVETTRLLRERAGEDDVLVRLFQERERETDACAKERGGRALGIERGKENKMKASVKASNPRHSPFSKMLEIRL
jgi:hypothetical protein